MLMIIQFEGVLGDLTKKNICDENLQLSLRKDAADGLRELLVHYQVVLFSFYSEKSIKSIVQYFLKEENIVFDAVYTQL